MQNSKRMEALFNEYKGNLFEFLVAKTIAQFFDFEHEFLSSYQASDFDILTQQEDFVRNYYPSYLNFLPNAAKDVVALLVKEKYFSGKLEGIKVIGKKEASQSIREGYNEADLIVELSNTTLPISLKFTKAQSFLNTKSAGIKSFFVKYFRSYEGIQEVQEKFNEFWELEFESFARKLHESIDLEYTSLFDNWKKYRAESLPGELVGEQQQILHQFYSQVNHKLYLNLKKLFELDKMKFTQALMPLVGFSSDKVIQVSYLFSGGEDHHNKILIHSWKDVKNMLENDHFQMKQNKANCEIVNKDLKLQIRLKPMNTFLNKGYKINCAVKFN